ncbi:hypothetical protein [Microbacterium panaciterrae]|uniref:Uncharacterized protein n=1 Tax=Microbacterium panaciterrae TaxID=985759 RepID=A0ABP8P4W7_9MICO
MTSNPIIWVAFVIVLGTLAVWIVQLVRARRGGGGDGDGGAGRGAWWEGPWDEDKPDR